MRLLLENWRKYLAEDIAQQFPWLKDIPTPERGVEFGKSLGDELFVDDHFVRVGQGMFRTVFSPRGDDDYVIKVVHDHLDNEQLTMNKDDFDTAKQYPFIFPKAYVHADDFSWIVVDRTSPIRTPDQMQAVLDKSFPAEQEAILGASAQDNKLHFSKGFNPADPFHIMGVIMNSFRDDRDIPPAQEYGEDPAWVQALDNKALEIQKIIAPVAGHTYQELSKAMQEFEIDKQEIRLGNIGYDEDYNFKIIDSSVFSTDIDSGFPQ
jgi:hypothetical protein